MTVNCGATLFVPLGSIALDSMKSYSRNISLVFDTFLGRIHSIMLLILSKGILD